MPIHIAITRRVRPGCEAEFQAALSEFFQTSFAHGGVLGASMLTPAPGSDSREFGILRTFANETERSAFYESPMFRAWQDQAGRLTDGEPEYRQLHGLEAWFRSPHNPPPRWKMAVATLCGVYPTSLLLGTFVTPLLHGFSRPMAALVTGIGMVLCLTWVVMPCVITLLGRWLHPKSN